MRSAGQHTPEAYRAPRASEVPTEVIAEFDKQLTALHELSPRPQSRRAARRARGGPGRRSTPWWIPVVLLLLGAPPVIVLIYLIRA